MNFLRLSAGFLILALALPNLSAKAAEAPCQVRTFEGDGFIVCLYDPARDRLLLAHRTARGPIGDFGALKATLGRRARQLAFAMNAGMYEADQSPVGLLVERGNVRHPLNLASGDGNFYLKPNGVFWVDRTGLPHIQETSAFAAHKLRALWATQSGPLLVSAGALNPTIATNGSSLHVRNAVGVKGDDAYFVISQTPVSFGRLARFMRDDLGCSEVLYLDGAVSSLWAPSLKRMDSRAGLGTFIVVLNRPR